MVLNFLNLSLSGKLLTFLSNFIESLAGLSTLGCRLFSFITFNIWCHSFSLIEFLLRNQLITLWEFPCMVFVFFPLLLLIFFFVFNYCQFHYYVSQYVPHWAYPAWDSLWFLNSVDNFLSYVREVFRYYLFKYFLRSFLYFFLETL